MISHIASGGTRAVLYLSVPRMCTPSTADGRAKVVRPHVVGVGHGPRVRQRAMASDVGGVPPDAAAHASHCLSTWQRHCASATCRSGGCTRSHAATSAAFIARDDHASLLFAG